MQRVKLLVQPPKPRREPAEATRRHPGVRVQRLRTFCDGSLPTLAGAGGVSRSLLSQIECEKANPALVVTLRIAPCGATMKIIALIERHQTKVIEKILQLGFRR